MDGTRRGRWLTIGGWLSRCRDGLTWLVVLWLVGLAAASGGAEAAGRRPMAWEPMPLPTETSGAGLYAVAPDVPACRSGRLSQTERNRVLAVVNDIRRLHGLGEVVWDSAQEEAAMSAALVFAANGQISHQPGGDWRCSSAASARGAAMSNIHLWVGTPGGAPRPSEDVVVGFLTDVNNRMAGSVGHRRWLLDPFLKRVAFGRVGAQIDGLLHDGAALTVVDPSARSGEPNRGVARADHWAYPEGRYPAKYFHPDALLSFSAIVDLNDRAANLAVDYSNASITLRRADGAALSVTQVSHDHQVWGLPNSLQFRAPGIVPDIEHEVLIQGVRVDGQRRDYRYRFRIES